MRYNWDKMTDTQKIQAIDKELSLETHMGVTKEDLVNMIRYLRDQMDVVESEPMVAVSEAKAQIDKQIETCAICKDLQTSGL